jgi:hypothetical protein
MSDQLTTAQVRQYHANIERLLQQKGGVLSPYVRVESQSSEKQFYEQIGGVVAEQVTSRFAPSPQVNTPHDRRMVTLTPYHVGDFIDSFEKAQTLADPSSAYVENFVMALNRERDRTIYQSFFGAASTGKEGTGSETFPTTLSSSNGNTIGVDFGTGNSGLTLAKLIEAKRQALAFHNDMGAEQWYIIINSAGLADLLNTTEVKSADYNTVKALVAGDVDTFLGFKFIQWEGYVLNGTNVMRGTGGGSEVVDMFPVFCKSSVINAVGMNVTTRVVERQDNSFNWYAYARAMYGATRMQLNKVLKIERYVSG